MKCRTKISHLALLLMLSLVCFEVFAKTEVKTELTEADKKIIAQGKTDYGSTCVACHLPTGTGLPNMAPSFVASKRVLGKKEILIRIILDGLTGPIDGKKYQPLVMIAWKTTMKDDKIAAISSYIRNSFGNTAAMITAEDVAKIRKEEKERKTTWTLKELSEKFPDKKK
jgi:mono/diheme cytochrome c family protein